MCKQHETIDVCVVHMLDSFKACKDMCSSHVFWRPAVQSLSDLRGTKEPSFVSPAWGLVTTLGKVRKWEDNMEKIMGSLVVILEIV